MEDYGGVQSIEVFGSAINDPFGRTSIYGTPHMYLYVCDSTPTTATISYTYNPLHQSASSLIPKKILATAPMRPVPSIEASDPRNRVPRWLVMVHPSVPWILVFNSSSH